MAPRRRGRVVPPAAPAHGEAIVCDQHSERREALASGDPARVRAWAARWNVPLLPCDDAALMESVHAAQAIEEARCLEALDGACRDVAAQIVAQPAYVRDRLIRSLAESRATDPIRREMDRTIAMHARRLTGLEKA